MNSLIQRASTQRFKLLLKAPYSTSNEGQLLAQRLKVTPTATPKPLIPLNKLVFGQAFTDHMLTIDWSASKGNVFPFSKAFFFYTKIERIWSV